LLPAACTAPPTVDASARARDRMQLSAKLLDLADYGASRFQAVYIDGLVHNLPPRQLATLGLIRNEAVANLRSVALGEDPGRDLVDLYVWSRIARAVCQERERRLPNLAPSIYGSTYEPIGLRVDALAREWLPADRLKRIDAAIDAYLAAHPNMLTASLFRMVDLKERDEGEVEETLAADDGMFSPVSDAARELERTRITGQQMLWMMARMPTAAGWEAQTQVAQALSSPEVEDLRAQVTGLQGGVHALSASVQELGQVVVGNGGLRGVLREAIVTGGAVLAGLLVLCIVGAALITRMVRRRSR
jgi:hypothetical protein